MARVEKYTRTACGHLFKHYERAKDESGNYIKFGNTNIDITRTHLNYNLAPDHGVSQYDFIKKRVEVDGVKLQNRKDVNLMCCWVVTLPKDFNGEERDFFEAAYEFMAKRYGEENVISAYVHVDEKQPHMHFSFCPVTKDERRGGYKVSAKEVLTRQELREFHGELQKYLDDKGIECSVLNELTRDGNKAIADLKRESAIQKIKEMDEFDVKRTEFNNKMIEMNDKVKRFYAHKKAVNDELEASKRELEASIKVEKEKIAYLNGAITKVREFCKTAITTDIYQFMPDRCKEQINELRQQMDIVVQDTNEQLRRKPTREKDFDFDER